MKAKQTVMRRHKHGINSAMINDAFDSSNIKDIKVDEKPVTPSAPEPEGLIPVI